MKLNIMIGALAASLLMGASPQGFAAETEEPIITFKTNIYDTYGDTNHFGIVLGSKEETYFDIDTGFGTEEVKVDVAEFNYETGAVEGTYVGCRVSSDGIVRIYGDPAQIDYFYAEGCYIDWIDMDACTDLTVLDLQHNELKHLDLTPFTKLEALYLGGNTFTAETPLIVGANKPNLTILELDVIEHLDQSFNLSDYPAIVAFDGYHCMSLYNVDPTGCPELQSLTIEMAPVSALDVTKNPKLTTLNISETRISSIDLSACPNLQSFYAEHVSGSINTDVFLKNVDVTHNPRLIRLVLGGNRLKSVDLSKNTYLYQLQLNRNDLTAIDLTANTNLASVNLAYNELDFATLPLPEATWSEYYYYRSPMACNRSYAVDTPIDFSSRVLREGTETSARVWRNPYDREPELIDESAYSYADGKVTFHEIPEDSVYIEFSNSAFPEYTISSAQFKVKSAEEMDKPSEIFSLLPGFSMGGKTLSLKVGLDNASDAAPQTFYVDCGNGLVPVTATTVGAPAEPNVNVALPTGLPKTVTFYLPEGASMTALEITDVPLQSINITPAHELRTLTLQNCNLKEIDLSYNRCLTALNLSGNRLTEVSLAGVYGDYEKNVLADIDLSDNQLTELTLVNNGYIKNLDLSGNNFTTYSLKDYDELVNLDLSDNRLAGELNLAYLVNAENIDLSGNLLTSLTIDQLPKIRHFDISDNDFTLQTLPVITTGEYSYAPQHQLEIVDKAPAVNLTAQNRIIDGVGTTFTWKKADGTPLVNGVDMDCADGATRFLDTSLGEVYCEMTNPAFPQLSGENVFKTTMTTVVGAPTTVVASFTTTEDSNTGSVIFTGAKTTALYIDWRGDGTEYIQYPMNSEIYTIYSDQTTYAGADVKVYTYDSPEDVTVFSINGIKMSRFDASALTNLVALTVTGAGLDDSSLVMPASPGMKELNLEGNNFSTKSFADYTELKHLILTDNGYTSFDASVYPGIETLMLGKNELTTVKLENPSLWGLNLELNRFETLSLAGAPALEQVVLNDNKLTSVDLSQAAGRLMYLDLSDNCLNFATLPLASSLRSGAIYKYLGQAPVEAECVDGKVDLSSQAEVGGTPTTFAWYLGTPGYDEITGELSGEALETDVDDPEYTVTDGVTSFYYTFDKQVTCVMNNSLFPSLDLFTVPVTVDRPAGVENVAADSDADAPVDVYTISGILLRSQVSAAEATRGLAPGLYIVGTQKVLVR